MKMPSRELKYRPGASMDQVRKGDPLLVTKRGRTLVPAKWGLLFLSSDKQPAKATAEFAFEAFNPPMAP